MGIIFVKYRSSPFAVVPYFPIEECTNKWWSNYVKSIMKLNNQTDWFMQISNRCIIKTSIISPILGILPQACFILRDFVFNTSS